MPLKKDNVVKHGKSDMHRKAVDLETNQSLTLEAYDLICSLAHRYMI